MGLDYKSSGVDIEAGYRSVELMKEHVKRTMRPEVLGGLGGFSGAFSLEKIKDMEKPVLLSGIIRAAARRAEMLSATLKNGIPVRQWA